MIYSNTWYHFLMDLACRLCQYSLYHRLLIVPWPMLIFTLNGKYLNAVVFIGKDNLFVNALI